MFLKIELTVPSSKPVTSPYNSVQKKKKKSEHIGLIESIDPIIKCCQVS